jgi:hypothetical protein
MAEDVANELACLAESVCPDCNGTVFRLGPCGGLAQNIECTMCGSRFNVARWRGMFVWAQRIGNVGEWPEDLYPLRQRGGGA